MDDNENFIDIEFGCPICGTINGECNCIADWHGQPGFNPFDKYRIRRRDPNNIVIERFGDKNWRVISYHGNSASSLVSGVFNVIMANHTPTDAKLADALERLRTELVSSVTKVEKMIRESDCGN